MKLSRFFFFAREREKERKEFFQRPCRVGVMTIRVIKVLERCLNGMEFNGKLDIECNRKFQALILIFIYGNIKF